MPPRSPSVSPHFVTTSVPVPSRSDSDFGFGGGGGGGEGRGIVPAVACHRDDAHDGALLVEQNFLPPASAFKASGVDNSVVTQGRSSPEPPPCKLIRRVILSARPMAGFVRFPKHNQDDSRLEEANNRARAIAADLTSFTETGGTHDHT